MYSENEIRDLIARLRNKVSRDNAHLLNEAANTLEHLIEPIFVSVKDEEYFPCLVTVSTNEYGEHDVHWIRRRQKDEWHDLVENPEDLPPDKVQVLIYHSWDGFITGHYEYPEEDSPYSGEWIYTSYPDNDDYEHFSYDPEDAHPVAWMPIEPPDMDEY